MNKKDLVKAVASELDMTQKLVGEVIDATLDGIVAGLKEDGKVTLIGFGNFEVKERSARTGVNPATGETLEIPAKNVAKFKAGKALKEAVV